MNRILNESPILFYDNYCTSCTKFAQIADNLSGHRIVTIGLYSDEADEFRSSTRYWSEMSWFVIGNWYHGGRAGLFRMIKYLLLERSGNKVHNKYDLNECKTDCMTIKGVWFRSMSILTQYKIFCKPSKENEK